MKITPINNIFYNSNNNKKISHNYSLNPLFVQMDSKDIVSFKRNHKDKLKTPVIKIKKTKQTRDLKKVPHIICACCGVETVHISEISKFVENELLYKGANAINILKQAGYFKPKKLSVNEKKAFMFAVMCARLYPEETLGRIFEKSFIKEKINNFDKKTIKEIYKIQEMTESIYHDSQYMVEHISRFKNHMHPTEKEVFELLEKESTRAPEKTFTEILNQPRIKEKSLKDLERKQNRIFNEIAEIAKKLSPASEKKVMNAVENSRIIFDQVVPEINNKRTLVLDIFKQIAPTVQEKEQMQRILYKIYSLPSSRNDASSFIIKYSSMNPNSIAKALLNSSISTIEHVKPKNRPNDKGEDKITNYIVLCSKCNSERQQIPYSEFMKFHPDMPNNLQKYLDIIVENINNGTLVGYDEYPTAIIETIDKEAKTKRLLQLRNLNIIEAKKNRIKKSK